MHLVMRMGVKMPDTIPRQFLELEGELAPELAEAKGKDPILRHEIYHQLWARSVALNAWVALKEKWSALGETCPIEPLYGFHRENPDDADLPGLAATLHLNEAETAMLVSRLQRHYRETLRLEIQDAVLRPTDVDQEIKELFPE